MITSLFKIVGLSLLSICPFHNLGDSSVNDYDLSANQVVKTDLNKKLGYYDSNNNVISVSQSDFDNGYLDGFSCSVAHESDIEISITYYINGVQYTSNIVKYSYTLGQVLTLTSPVSLGRITNSYEIDFSEKTLTRYSYDRGTLTNSRSFDSIILPFNSNIWYNGFYSELVDFISDRTTIVFNSSALNEFYYKNLTLALISNPSLVQYASVYYGASGSIEVESNNVNFNIGDDKIYLYSEGDKPLYIFYSNDLGGDSAFGGFSSNLYIYVNDFDSYNELLIAYNLRSSLSNYGDYKESFTFEMVFNYNAPYLRNIDSLFVQDSYFTSDTATTYHKYVYYSLPSFQSNGQIFNAVWVEYLNGYSTGYIIGDSTAVGGVGNGYFQHLWFVNVDTNYQKLVCYRNYTEKTINNNINTYLSTGCTWVNTDYRHIYFFESLDSEQKNSLAQFNNLNYSNGLNGGSVSLNDSFAVINTGLTGLMGFLSIQLLPGITIGTLILIPFVITLMLFIVKLFKR